MECAECELPFEKSTSKYNEAIKLGRTKHYCSRTCANNRHEKTVETLCGHCGKKTEIMGRKYRYKTKTLGRNTLFCSRSCSANYHSGQIRETAKKQVSKECRICKEVKPISEFRKREHTTRSECLNCQAKLMREWIENGGWLNRKQSHAKRRAQKRITSVVAVSFEEIIRRDNQVCYLCGEYVESGDTEFDHVVPLSRGGHHVMDNIKVTHSWCNQRKRDKYLHELDWCL